MTHGFYGFVGAVFASGLLACNLVSNSSNFPDSGIACNSLSPDAGGVSPTVPAGSGSLTGDRRFTVRSSYQTRQSRMSEGHTISSLWFGLYADTYGCADRRQSLDGGAPAGEGVLPGVSGHLFDTGRYEFPPGPYPVGRRSDRDAGMSARLDLFALSASDGGVEHAQGTAGVVNITSLASCTLTGTFDATFELPDGGSTSLSGSFASAFCE